MERLSADELRDESSMEHDLGNETVNDRVLEDKDDVESASNHHNNAG